MVLEHISISDIPHKALTEVNIKQTMQAIDVHVKIRHDEVKIFTRSGKIKYHTIRILLGSGGSSEIISGCLIPKARPKNNTTTKWYTRGGVFQT